MTPGQIVRRILGPAFQPVGEAYRRIFVDMDKVTDWMIGHIPQNARVIDVGGGDGYVVNLLLAKRPDIHVTMTDIAPEIGGFVTAENLSRATLMPGSQVDQVKGRFDVMTLADVIHHVPVSERPGFYASLSELAQRTGCKVVMIKDIAPGYVRSALSLLSDWYITGDRHVRLAWPQSVILPKFKRTEHALPDPPNYCMAFTPIYPG
jgi:hypothetical protein